MRVLINQITDRSEKIVGKFFQNSGFDLLTNSLPSIILSLTEGATINQITNCFFRRKIMLLSELTQYEQLIDLYDAISDGLSDEHWTERFLSAIRPEADLSTIHHKFFLWLISRSDEPSMEEVIRLHQAMIDGKKVIDKEWVDAYYLAYDSGAYVAAYSIAANSAICVASASYGSIPCPWTEIADKLIELLKDTTKLLPSQLLAKKENWTKGDSARDQNGEPVAILSEDAVSFCIYGACVRCNVDREKLRIIIKAHGFRSMEKFNDDPNTTHDDVLSVLQEAGL